MDESKRDDRSGLLRLGAWEHQCFAAEPVNMAASVHVQYKCSIDVWLNAQHRKEKSGEGGEGGEPFDMWCSVWLGSRNAFRGLLETMANRNRSSECFDEANACVCVILDRWTGSR